VKGKRERERYIQLNAEFQRIARRDKKALLNEQCKEVEENKSGKDQKSLQENWSYQENISCKDGQNEHNCSLNILSHCSSLGLK